MNLSGRQLVLAQWIYERFGDYARVRDVLCLDDLELPTDVLLHHLQATYDLRKPRSVNYFFASLGLLHQWESDWRQQSTGERGDGVQPLSEILSEYQSRWTSRP